jgi:hypothetical protein
MFDIETHYSEYKKFRRSIDSLPHEYHRDLKNMLVTLDQLVLHIHVEQVTCKQRRKVTSDYDQLLTIYEKHRENLEQQLVLAILSA